MISREKQAIQQSSIRNVKAMLVHVTQKMTMATCDISTVLSLFKFQVFLLLPSAALKYCLSLKQRNQIFKNLSHTVPSLFCFYF